MSSGARALGRVLVVVIKKLGKGAIPGGICKTDPGREVSAPSVHRPSVQISKEKKQ